jgi:hypothetical protein
MSKGSSGSIVVVLRKISSGHKVVAFQGDSMDHMYSIARILIGSQEYNRCYAVGADWQGNQLFNVQPEQVYQAPAPYQAPQQGYPQMPQGVYPQQYALPPYQQRPSPPPMPQQGQPYGPPPGYRAVPAYVEDSYAAEPSPAPIQRAFPALPWKGGR